MLTIHDLQPLERRATHGRAKRAYLSAVLPRSVKRARAIAVPSDFVRRSVLQRFGADPHRVVTIPHGVAWDGAGATSVDEVRARYDLRGPVVLYPAITYPHKDHATLVEAFALVRRDHPDAVLVLTGGEGACEGDLAERVARLGLGDAVRRTGRVTTADVAGLYSVATVVAVPSTYEGFGLPAAEAMAAGVALVAASGTALPEVVGEAGILVEPGDVGAWADAIGRLLADAGERTRLAELGRRQVQRFTWDGQRGGLRRALPTGRGPGDRQAGLNGSRPAPLVGWATLWVRHPRPRRWLARPGPVAGCRPVSPAASCSRGCSRSSWSSA